ncbi:hypothetical protein MMC27_003560 [Xylographa pallens]|nr:hypothetical protein [Xylographa pallens]
MNRLHTSIPRLQTGIRTGADGSLLEARDIPVPGCSPNAILVKVHSVALNPSDYKMPDLVRTSGLLAGCDFAGEIVEVGSEVQRVEQRPGRAPWAVGDRVCGAVHGSNTRYPTWGSFAQFVEADPVVLIRAPKGWSWTDAAAVGGSCVGAVGLALFHHMGLDLPRSDNEGTNGGVGSRGAENARTVVLVYGGSTACGTMALQMLRLAGYSPVTVCSPHNDTLAKTYGAATCFDYHSEQCAQQIKAHTKNSLSLVLDCIGTVDSAALCYAAIGRAGGRYVALEKLPDGATGARRVVRASWAMGPLMFGRTIDMGEYSFDPDGSAREFGRHWYALVEELGERGKLRCHPARIVGGQQQSWTSAVRHGLSLLRENAISGAKLVVEIDQPR